MATTYKYVPFEYVIARKVQLKQAKAVIYLHIKYKKVDVLVIDDFRLFIYKLE
jgi:chromosomal replication initiation ATPase DnaA